MNFILPVTKPVNHSEIRHWISEYLDIYIRYKKFINDMESIGIDENNAMSKWLNNYGEIPPNRPTEFYTCNIINSEIKLVLTVRRNTDENAKREFEVVKLNKVYLSSYDIHSTEYLALYTEKDGITGEEKTKLKIDIEGSNSDMSILNKRNSFITGDEMLVEYETKTFLLNEPNNEENGQISFDLINDELEDMSIYRINYEDSSWFTFLKVRDLLNRIRIKVNLYETEPNIDEIPKIFLYNMHCMEIIDFDFVDDDKFKERLYDLINNKFMEMIA